MGAHASSRSKVAERVKELRASPHHRRCVPVASAWSYMAGEDRRPLAFGAVAHLAMRLRAVEDRAFARRTASQ